MDRITATGLAKTFDLKAGQFAEVEGRTGSEALRNTRLVVDLEDEADPEDDAWYPHQLQGLAAVTMTGTPLGTVKDLLTGGAQDVLVVTGTDGEPAGRGLAGPAAAPGRASGSAGAQPPSSPSRASTTITPTTRPRTCVTVASRPVARFGVTTVRLLRWRPCPAC